MSNVPLISVEDVTFYYFNDKKILDRINVAIPSGAKVVIVGPNGAGKSTLFLHLNAILKPHSGRIMYMGKRYEYSRSFIKALRQKIGLVFQDPDTQLFADNVLDDVLFGPVNLGLPLHEAKKRAYAALESVQMNKYIDEPVHYLSHGQKKRVAIAGVLAMSPDVLVMDEPTSGLDCQGIDSLDSIMADLHKAGKTLVVSTHDVNWAWQWADIVCVLVGGQIIASGFPEDIFNSALSEKRWFARPVIGQIYEAIEGNISRAKTIPRTVNQLIELLEIEKK